MIALILLSYFLGSIPFGFLVARLVKKIDLREFGSGNIGATNVLRVVGKPWAALVFILDFLKGFIPCLLAKFLLGSAPAYIFIIIAILPVFGHNWTPFLKFKGGKGVATSLGGICALSLIFQNLFIVLISAILVWAFIFLVFRYVSLASILSAVTFVIFSFALSLPKEIRILSFILLLFILIRHKKNIKNLFAKREYRF